MSIVNPILTPISLTNQSLLDNNMDDHELFNDINNIQSNHPNFLSTSNVVTFAPSTNAPPSNAPTFVPPSNAPTFVPTNAPTNAPTFAPPSNAPTFVPTTAPTDAPTFAPTNTPPSNAPSSNLPQSNTPLIQPSMQMHDEQQQNDYITNLYIQNKTCNDGKYIYSVFHVMMSIIAVYLSIRCNKVINYGSLIIAFCFPYPYIIYSLIYVCI